MVLYFTFLIISLIGSLLTYFLSGLYTNIAFLWLPFVLVLAYFVGLFVINLLIVAIATLFVDLDKDQVKPNKYFAFQIKNFSQFSLKMSLVKVHLIGKEKLPENRKDNRFVFVSNHMSNYDHLAVMQALHSYPTVSLSKPELEQLPVLGKSQHKAGFIVIDRNDQVKAMQAIKKCISYLKNQYANILICPEGTRSKTGVLTEFHPMTFIIPSRAKCPLVVASIKNTNNVKKNFPKRITHVYVEIIKVFDKEDYERISASELSKISHDLIKENLGQ